MTKYLVVILLVIASTTYAEPRVRPAAWAQPIIETNLENLYYVDEGIFRSEQPREEDFNALVSLGIKEILNLREFHSDRDNWPGENFILHRIKIKTSKITEDQIIAALRIIKNRKGPILIHCWHGSDRTGVVVAAYRIVFNNWSKSHALDEMVNGGYGYHAKIYSGLVGIVENLDVEHIKKSINL